MFDILQLDANDAITVNAPHVCGDEFANRLNLVLLQRLQSLACLPMLLVIIFANNKTLPLQFAFTPL